MRMWYDMAGQRLAMSAIIGMIGGSWTTVAHRRRATGTAGRGEPGVDFKAGDIVVVKDDAAVRPELRGMKGTIVEIIENGQIRVRSDSTGNDEWFSASDLRHE